MFVTWHHNFKSNPMLIVSKINMEVKTCTYIFMCLFPLGIVLFAKLISEVVFTCKILKNVARSPS